MEILTESKETQPKERWGSVEEYIHYLKQFAAYKFAKKFVINKKVLEIGHGAGYGADYASDFASGFVAIDMSKINSSYCQRKYPKENLIFMTADATNLPFKDDQFDVAISFQVIEHIEPKFVLTYLAEIKRVIKSDGIFICSTPNKKLRLLPFQKPWNTEHKKEYNHKEFKNLLNKVFEDVRVYGLSASKEALSVERARVKQDPLKVYIISPLYRLIKTILPSAFSVRLKEVGKRFISSKISQNSIQKEDFLTKYSLEDFKVDSSCPDDCLDLLGVCKKNIDPLGMALNIESYFDYRRIIRGHSSKSLKRILIYFFLKNPIRLITHIFDFDIIFRFFSFLNCSISHFFRFLSIATAILYGTLLFERT
jgi:SAM-dependent methyltransferase